VSIVDPVELRTILEIPAPVVPIAYLCIGYTSHFAARPELELSQWESRIALASVLFFDRYGDRDDRRAGSLSPEPHEASTPEK
jgi:5,6-dimethylbenzimidazole synthase